MKKRIFSGIQPSGDLHIGNYLGAIKNWVELQKDYDCVYCIVDLHAITVRQDPKLLKKRIRDLANFLIAAGINPRKSVLLVQSNRPEHAELAWILNCYAYIGELSRMTQFKEKAGEEKETVSVGLFDYPILMAADILLYNTDVVPVGEDQKQHIEITRDLANRFNNLYDKTFVVPEPLIKEVGARIMGLDDPTKKMSKSAGSKYNYIAFDDSEDEVRDKVLKAVTDSGNEIKFDKVKKPAISNLLTIYSLISNKSIPGLEKQYAGKGYAEFKKDLADVVVDFIKPLQNKIKGLEKDPAYTEKVLREGSEKIAPIAQATLKKVKEKIGLG